MEKNWFASCYRKLFLDYHLQKTAVQVGQNFRAAEWAQQLQEAGVQAVSCFSKCAFGWRYYQKGTVGRLHPNLPQGMDLLEDTIRECHKRGIRVIAYYHTMGSEYYAELHPEYRITDSRGNRDFRGICMLSPAAEEEMLPQIGEIAKNYDIDGMFFDGTYLGGGVCYCEGCKKRYREETGRELPASESGPEYEAYTAWALDAYEKLRQRVIAVVHENNPGALAAINWCYSSRQPAPVPDGIGFLSEDIGPGNMLSYASQAARFWALTGTPFDIMNHMSLKWWLEWGVKPVNSLKQESAVIAANGGKTWVGYQMYPQYGVSPYLFRVLKENFDFVRTMEPVLDGAQILPYIGVLHSEQQIHPHPDGSCPVMSGEESLSGIHRALTFSGIHYNSCSDAVFQKHLDQFRAVILSGNTPLREEQTEALERYTANGGCLLLTGMTGMQDCRGNFQKNEKLEKILGIEVTGSLPYSHGYLELPEDSPISAGTMGMPMLSSRPFASVRPAGAAVLAGTRAIYLRGDGNPLFNELNSRDTFSPPGLPLDSPAITIHHYGKGKAVYIATDIFESYAGGSQWYMKNLARNIIQELLLGDAAIRVDGSGYVETALAFRDGCLLLHLINLVREWPASSLSQVTEHIIGENILPVADIRITVPSLCCPGEITTLTGQRLPFSYAEGKIRCTLPKLEIHDCVIIRGARLPAPPASQ